MKFYIFVIYIFFEAICKPDTLQRFLLKDPTALCLDGSPGAYYISIGQQKNKFILYFEGGAWCGNTTLQSTYESCYNRSKTKRGSSLFFPQEVSYDGILSGQQQNIFKNWTKVFLKYCDGSGHQGTRSQPLQFNNQKIYFRGNNITIAQFNQVEQNHGLFSSSSQIIVTGSSAGGLAAFMWVDYVNSKSQFAKVYGVPDAGVFLDSKNINTNRYDYRQSFRNLFKISNVQIDPPVPQCVEKFPNSKYMCMLVENLYEFIETPLFPIQSLYDVWSLDHILGISCFSKGSFEKCSSTEINIIEQYRKNMTNLFSVIQRKQENGYWAVACPIHASIHTKRIFDNNFCIPAKSQNSISNTLKSWLYESSQKDTFFLDNTTWPQNVPCSGLPKKLLREQCVTIQSSGCQISYNLYKQSSVIFERCTIKQKQCSQDQKDIQCSIYQSDNQSFCLKQCCESDQIFELTLQTLQKCSQKIEINEKEESKTIFIILLTFGTFLCLLVSYNNSFARSYINKVQRYCQYVKQVISNWKFIKKLRYSKNSHKKIESISQYQIDAGEGI